MMCTSGIRRMKCQFLVLLISYCVLERIHSKATEGPDFTDYVTPSECQAFETTDGLGVALNCDISVINHTCISFKHVQTRYTKSLKVTCTSSDRSSFENVSMAHLNELEEIVFHRCKFTTLERDTFSNLHKLRYLTIRGELDPLCSLVIDNSAIRQLQSIEELDLATNNIETFSKEDFCHLHNLQQVQLGQNKLTDIHDLGFSGPCKNGTKPCSKNLTHIFLPDNRISVLPNQSFCRLPSLVLLNLRGNNLQLLEPEAFSNLKSLLLLDLAENNLTLIPPNLWLDSNQLLILNMSHNSLGGTIDETMFRNLENLYDLDLSFNQIEIIDSTAFKTLTQLAFLRLSHNRIQNIQDRTFAQMSNLFDLFLDQNDIPVLDEHTLFGLTNLELLWINDNNISSIAYNAFASCPSLVNISVGGNCVTELPNLTVHSDLVILNASHNAIKTLSPDAFTVAKKLQAISLKRNDLTEIPESLFANLTELCLINLSENQISKLHRASFRTNHKLSHLHLAHNELGDLVDLTSNSNLVYLNLSRNNLNYLDFGLLPHSLGILAADHNKITSLKSMSFGNISITYLDLSQNQITSITDTSLPPSLVTVHLEDNRIQQISGGSFKSMQALQTVFLHNNNLGAIHKIVLLTSQKIRKPEFYLGGNPLMCNCITDWMLSINDDSNRNYGRIGDLDSKYCYLPPLRNVKSPELIFKVPPKHFLCQIEPCTPEPKYSCDDTCPVGCKCFRSKDWNTVIVDCNGSNVSSVPSNIPRGTSLLYLDGTFITSVNETSFNVMPILTELFLNQTGLKAIGDNSFANIGRLITLHLEFNSLKHLPMNSFAGLQHLHKLYLQFNALQQLHTDLFVPLQSLVTLQLDNNELVNLSTWSSQQMPLLKKVTLDQNPWQCECTAYHTWYNNYSDIISNASKLTCHPEHDANLTVTWNDFARTYCVKTAFRSRSHVMVIAITVAVFAAVALVCVLLFIYRHEMEVLIYSRYNVRLFHGQEEVDDDKKIYDAFLCCSNVDEEFAVHELIMKLENLDVPYRMCYHQRDFAAGAFITESIIEAVECSRRTIVLLTEHFTKSEWCRFEFKTAHLQMMKDKCKRVILILVGDVPNDLDAEMKLYLKTNTYLKWGDKLFWEKLYYALPSKQKNPRSTQSKNANFLLNATKRNSTPVKT